MSRRVLWQSRKPFWPRAVNYNSRQWMTTSTSPAGSGNSGRRRFEEMPTERGSSWLFGAGLEMATMPQGVFFSKMKEKHGKVFRVKVGIGKYLVVVGDVEGAEAIFRNEGKYPSRGIQLDAINLELDRKRMGLTDSGVTAAEGKQWKEARSKLNPVFVPRKLGRHVHKLNAVNDTFIRVAQEGAEADGYSKDLMELLPYWSMEGISTFLIPKGASFQGPNAPGAASVHGFIVFMENGMIANKYPKWWLKTLPVKSFKLACEGWARSMAGLRNLVQEAMRSYSASADVEEHTFLEQWVEQGMNENQIAVSIGRTMVAATDTTATTAAFALYHLSKYPEVQEEARKEVLSVVGRDGSIDDAALQKMPFIKACFKETTRLLPTAGGIPRSLPLDVEVGGYIIPKKGEGWLNWKSGH